VKEAMHMSTKLFAGILEMSLYGAAAAVIIMLVKLVAGRRLPIHFHKALWMILIIKLLLPFEIPSQLSLNHYIAHMLSPDSFLESSGSFREAERYDDPDASFADYYIADHHKGSENYQSAPIAPDMFDVHVPNTGIPTPKQTMSPTADWMTIAAYIWLAGMLAFLVTFLMAYCKTISTLKSYEPYTNAENRNKIRKLMEECRQELSCKRDITVIPTSHFSIPFVFGLLKPAVVLPEGLMDTLDEEQLKSILLHEITHIQKHDPLIRCLAAVLQAVHWFNPVLWAAFSWMAKDCERACDDAVIRKYDSKRRMQYASTLYSLAEGRSSKNMLPMLAFGENNIKTRIKDILERRKYSLVSIVAAVLILVAAAISMLTGEIRDARQSSFEVYVLEGEHTGNGIERADGAGRTLLFTHEDILAYDWEQQIIWIRNNGNFSSDLLKKDVEFVANGEAIFTATFWSPIFSMMPPEIPIYNQRLLFNETDDEICLLLGRWYPDPDIVSASVMSKIMDERIQKALEELHIPLAADQEMKIALSAWNPESAEEESEDIDLTDVQAASTPVDEPEDKVYTRVKFLLDQIIHSGSASSNPYDYINESQDFEELVSIGEPAMQSMFGMFAEQHDDGLKEYIMAAACARILGVYDEERGIGITSGKEWFIKYGQFGLDDLHFSDVDYNDFQNTGTIKDEIYLPERTDKTNLEEVLSDYILARQRHAFYMGEKAFEAHHILQTEEADGMVSVYMLVRFAWFEFQDGIFASVSGTGGIPVKMELKKSENGQYEVISYKEPMDGGMWRTSLQEMFPDDLVQLVTQRDNMVQWEEEQVSIITNKAAAYLKSIGRESFPVEYRYVPERNNEEYLKAIYQVTSFRKGFPEWPGSREALVNAGGPYPGLQIRCLMETSISKAGEGEYLITLTRTWDTVVNGNKPVSTWIYKVEGNSVSLIEEKNMDHLIALIK
jgi:beta-lactamase regulating signal transducer with metallopeptidase domain